MENTVIEGQDNGTATESQERTFTQAELDDIVKSRVAKERSKYSDYETLQAKASKLDEIEEASKSELQKATERAEALQKQIDQFTLENEVRSIREKVSNETGVPTTLLLGTTEEDCMEQAKAILAYKNETQELYPHVKDGGEARVSVKKTPEDQFADWFSKQVNS